MQLAHKCVCEVFACILSLNTCCRLGIGKSDKIRHQVGAVLVNCILYQIHYLASIMVEVQYVHFLALMCVLPEGLNCSPQVT